MTQRILIDAVHPEEVRVVLAQDNRLEEFDFETSAKKQIKSNIYLGKITRVEPSLQAAFVEYGGGRQGFLPFAEVHYDYFQIPTEDRQKIAELLEKERTSREEATEEEEDKTMSAKAPEDGVSTSVDADGKDVKAAAKPRRRKAPVKKPAARKTSAKAKESTETAAEKADDAKSTDKPSAPATTPSILEDKAAKRKEELLAALFGDDATPVRAHAKITPPVTAPVEDEEPDMAEPEILPVEEDNFQPSPAARPHRRGSHSHAKSSSRADAVDEDAEEKLDHDDLGGDDFDEMRHQRSQIFRNYKIQEVLKRNQIVLVQVIKEERGNKGASLTTYISLAGRYCVLMPNTDRAGGISRRITDIKQRKQLKGLMREMNLPKGASVIIRTAGMDRDVDEIRRDFQYLSGLWEDIRQRAVKATAPALIHEEGSLIKRCLRDLYRESIGEILVEGQEGFKTASDFMETMAPEAARKLRQYQESEPIFKRYGMDAQLDDLYDNTARLPSGGAIVLTPTEALVSIDVNSGRSTRERSIEDTAVKTNIEAAVEIARQLRLRDLAGLVVIDFIDMRELRNRKAVEAALKKALKQDRARIQVGRISTFGLLEMSRQRLRSSIVESSTVPCTHCGGTGFVRSDESTSIRLLRVIEAELARWRDEIFSIRTSTAAAFYLLNNKRDELSKLESDFGMKILIDHDHTLEGADFELDKPRGRRRQRDGRDRDGKDRDDRPRRDQRDNRDKERGDRDRERERPERDNRHQHDKKSFAQPREESHVEQADDAVEVADNQQPRQHDDNRRDSRNRNNRRRNRNDRPQRGNGNQGNEGENQAQQNYNTAPEHAPAASPSVQDAANDARPAPAAPAAASAEEDKESSKLRGLWKKITQ